MQQVSSLPSSFNNESQELKYNKDRAIWVKVLNKIKESQQDQKLDNLLNNAKFIKIKDNTLMISVKDSFVRETLIRNYFLIIKRITTSVSNDIKMISIIVNTNLQNITSTSSNSLNKVNSRQVVNSEISIQESSDDSIFSKANSKFIFANYITGESNIVAYKIAKDIASQNINYNHNNVFYVHSYVGMGKTHLLQSIVNELNNKKSQYNNPYSYPYKAGYLSAEKFMHNFVNAVKNNTLFNLRDKINAVDIFLIDDLQFICGKESTQREFTLILNSLIESGKKIVIASSVPCHMLELSDERTRSILRSSNTIYIEQCDYELRLKILYNYNNQNNIKFEANILEMIADKITTSVRELEAGLNNLKTYLGISGKQATNDNICNYVQHYIKSSSKKVTMLAIINAVAKYYKISPYDITSKKRTQKLVIGRQIIAYLAKEVTTDSLKMIGERIGGRDHSTILYYLKKLSERIKKNNHLLAEINSIKTSII